MKNLLRALLLSAPLLCGQIRVPGPGGYKPTGGGSGPPNTPVLNTATANVNPGTCLGHPTCAVTISSTTAGDTLGFYTRVGSVANSITGVTGCGTWTKLTSHAANSQTMELWAAPNVSAGCTSVSITWASSTSANWPTSFFTIGNMPTTLTADGSVGANTSNTGTVLTTGSTTTTHANDILFAVSSSGGTWTGPTCTNSFTAFEAAANNNTPYYRIVAATGTYSTGVTKGTSGTWVFDLVAIQGW